MSEVATTPLPSTSNGKRKRTGKQREERKKAAIEEAKRVADGGVEAVEAVTEVTEPVTEEVLEVQVKEDEVLASTTAAQPKPTADLEVIATRIPQALKTLHPIFKQAKTFETQRLIKKVKFLRTKSNTQDEVKDLETQLGLLSHIQTTSLAQTYLLLKLRKHHLLKSVQSTLPPAITTPLTPPPTTTPSTSTTPDMITKVENRLCSLKTVSDGIKPVISWLVGEAGATLISRAVIKQRKKVLEDGRKGLEDARKERMRLIEEARGLEGVESDDDDEVVIGGEEEEDAGDEAVLIDSEDEEEDQAADAAGWESGSVDGEFDESGSESDLEEASETSSNHLSQPISKKSKLSTKTSTKAVPTPPPATRKTKPLPRAPPPSSAPINSSTFLPTLATGFTRGGDSDSDPDMDFDPDGIIGSAKAERKNRRGQRARQAIWEKKYGKNAKHVQKAQTTELNNARGGGQGWTTRTVNADSVPTPLAPQKFDAVVPAATTSSRGRGGLPARGGTVSRGAAPGRGGIVAGGMGRGGAVARGGGFTRPEAGVGAGAGAATATAPAGTPRSGLSAFSSTTQSGAALHPSWEAARLRRQKEMGVTPGGAVAKPTKIVFD